MQYDKLDVKERKEQEVVYCKLTDPGEAYKLELCYSKGDGVVEDKQHAVKSFELAVDQGHADAQLNLGVCYSHGIGVDES